VKGQNVYTTYQVIDSILSENITAQLKGGIKRSTMSNKFSSALIELCFQVPICFVIGDVEGHDLLCGRYSNHQQKITR
jgi:hypothetical protein